MFWPCFQKFPRRKWWYRISICYCEPKYPWCGMSDGRSGRWQFTESVCGLSSAASKYRCLFSHTACCSLPPPSLPVFGSLSRQILKGDLIYRCVVNGGRDRRRNSSDASTGVHCDFKVGCWVPHTVKVPLAAHERAALSPTRTSAGCG